MNIAYLGYNEIDVNKDYKIIKVVEMNQKIPLIDTYDLAIVDFDSLVNNHTVQSGLNGALFSAKENGIPVIIIMPGRLDYNLSYEINGVNVSINFVQLINRIYDGVLQRTEKNMNPEITRNVTKNVVPPMYTYYVLNECTEIMTTRKSKKITAGYFGSLKVMLIPGTELKQKFNANYIYELYSDLIFKKIIFYPKWITEIDVLDSKKLEKQ